MAFIVAALDNNKYNCHSSTPSGVVCSKKWAIEAFIFLTFIFTVFALFLETTSLWLHRRKHQASQPLHEKHRSSSEHDGTAPAEGENSEEPTATSANTV
ncbi:hypothetical protein N7450_011687 [Penicillium hetheringtonii]|uniref:MARVEL domain-containing protein n=1 Tax=Penicillium hetheringtonii TaxID=911720 RepID=A0AAD6DAE9_9EURO|nr:hypothetical protein N7450_011687 [Penicillium hetheringtonii]